MPYCRCALCAFPASSCLVGMALALLWSWALWHETQRLWLAVINIRLRRRVRVFQVCSIAGEAIARGSASVECLTRNYTQPRISMLGTVC